MPASALISPAASPWGGSRAAISRADRRNRSVAADGGAGAGVAARRRGPHVRFRSLFIAAAIASALKGTPGRAGDARPAAEADPAAGRPGVVVPDTPAGRRLAAWAEAFNAGDRETLGRFFAGHTAPGSLLAKMPARDRLDAAMFLRGATGGVTLSKVETPSDHVVKAEVQARETGDWFGGRRHRGGRPALRVGRPRDVLHPRPRAGQVESAAERGRGPVGRRRLRRSARGRRPLLGRRARGPRRRADLHPGTWPGEQGLRGAQPPRHEVQPRRP